jgi:N-acetylmuramoyl-L-alanine amidase
MPSILVEAVFLSNPAEAEALRQGPRRDEVARAIVAGISAWFDRWPR